MKAIFRSWGRWPEWGVVVFLYAVLGIAVGSVERAQWVTPSPPLMLTLVLGVLAASIFHKRRLSSTVAHPVALLIGGAATAGFGAILLIPNGEPSGFSKLAQAVPLWWQAMGAAGGATQFVAFLVFFAWALGYVSAWYFLRRKNTWVGISLATVTLLVNLNNMTEQYYTWFIAYALAVMALLGISNLARHYSWSAAKGNPYTNRGMLYAVALVLGLSTLAVSAAWFAPAVRAEPVERLASSGTLWAKGLEDYIDDFLAEVPAKQPFLIDGERSGLLFGDSSFDRGDQPHFAIISDHAGYLRTRMFDAYAASGWTSSNPTHDTEIPETTGSGTSDATKRALVTYTLIPRMRTNILPSEGEFISADVPVSMEMLSAPRFQIDLMNAGRDSSLPQDIASLARTLRAAQSGSEPMRIAELREALPDGLELAGYGISSLSSDSAAPAQQPAPAGTRITSIDVMRAQSAPHDVVSVTSLYVLKPDRRYSVTASVSQATPEDLSRATNRYSRPVVDYYLQLPPSLPGRVRQISRTVTRDAGTPYDKAVAIQEYLARFRYDVDGATPPGGIDGIDYFLFSHNTGNCVQFSSAMAIMLRSVGVPTRLVVGYAPGEYQAATGASFVTDGERHAWTEVYFPGYGWVGFDPTPGGGSGAITEAPTDDILAASGGSDNILEEEFIDEMSIGLFDIDGTAFPSRRGPAPGLWLSGGAIVLLALTLALVIIARRKQAADDAPAVYRKLCFLASLLRMGPEAQQTPLEYCGTLVSALPDHSEAINEIGRAYTERRYSNNGQLSPWERWRLRNSWRQVRRRLLKRLFRLERRRP